MENTETGAEKEDKAIGEKQITVDDKIVQIVIDDSTGISLDDFHTNDKKILSLLNQDSDINDKESITSNAQTGRCRSCTENRKWL